MRAVLLPAHRYVGLVLALFLAIAGLTGSLPAWNEELEAAMKALFAHQRGLEGISKLPEPRLAPAISWGPALAAARAHMAVQARARGFVVEAEKALLYDPARGVYRYDVRTSHDIRHRGGHTRLVMDADSGAFRGLWLPTGAAGGDSISTWLATLHMAALGGWPVQLLICLMGLVVAMLSVTGVLVWLKKRQHAPGAA